ncbi:hypothetical protein ACI2I2_20050 [Scandinavium sp. NPDC088450]|uniref:hypothetical protein n=1 Tax=Scandinavium sp. NPDC088450 TaxID=3364514 RepID=UPI00384EDAA7
MNMQTSQPGGLELDLEAIAAGAPGGAQPLCLSTTTEQAALAADALWQFAQKTGLDTPGEPLETVLVDFMTNLLHLCRLTGVITDEENHFTGIMQTAEMHCELEEGEYDA